FLTLIGVAVAILSYFGFKRRDRIGSEARENMEESEQHAEEAQRYVEDIKTMRDKIKIDSAVSEAISLQQQNRTDEAIEKWRSIANITEGTDDERAAEAWFFVGYFTSLKSVKEEREDFAGVIDAYNKSIDLNLSGPNLPYAYFNRGNVKARLGQTKSAIADYDAAIDLNSSDADFYIRRGIAKQKSGDSEGAMADFDAAIGLNPSDVSTYLKQGAVKVFSGRIDEAREPFEKALDLAREEGNAYLTAQLESMLESLNRRDAT
ncbi:MAG: tetratricopeptide repeat protein, partial [Gemmatimonadetes bacterium]|nr:tetratricopeptide repeat protein [Gemmatimonadota bacterium]